jgi:TatD DNase family protein
MEIIDSHCHLDDFFREGVLDDVLERAERASVTRLIAVGTHSVDWKFYGELVKTRGNIFYTIGLHPLLAEEFESVGRMHEFFTGPIAPIAIGEIGLDYHRLPDELDARSAEIALQKSIFSEQLKFAIARRLPVVIHSRQAFADTFATLVASGIGGSRVLFHCYDYGADEMQKIMDFGAFVSFSGTLTYKKITAAQIKLADPQRMLIETDCPYLTPQEHKPKRNEPAYIVSTAAFGAKLLDMRMDDFCDLTCGNTERFFAIG